MEKENREIEKHLRLIELLLAESLLQGSPKPNVHSLERFIGVRKGTLAKLQSEDQAKEKARTPVKRGENNAKTH